MATIARLELEHVAPVARLHRDSLAGDFLPSLGEGFLRALYRGMLELELVWGWVALEDGQVVGFVLGTPDSRGLFTRLLRARFLSLSSEVLRALLRRPSLIGRTLQTFLYPMKEGTEAAPAELLVIAVRADRRGARIGEELVRRLDQSAADRGIPAYKLTVLERNQGANRFYRRLGFELKSTFSLYGLGWNLYQRATALEPEPPP